MMLAVGASQVFSVQNDAETPTLQVFNLSDLQSDLEVEGAGCNSLYR